MKKENQYSVRVRVWIEEANGHFLGIGRVQLLENIEKTGSITNAAKKMKMSYRQAWQFVEDMNNQANDPLVEKLLGGAGGGGARLTDAGKKAIIIYYRLEKNTREFADKETAKIKF